MTTKEPHSVDTALRAWELYAAEKYQELIRLEAAGHVPEVHDLLRLASCETGKTLPLTSGKASGESLFGPLAEAVEAHEREEYASAARMLGVWLKKKPYYTKSVIQRFVDACQRSNEHFLLKDVMGRFSGVSALKDTVIAALFEASYASEEYGEALKLYKENPRVLTSELHRRLAAMCLLHARDYRNAEALLLKLHKDATGKDFKLDYDAAKKTWEPTIARIDELEAMERTEQETMSLGMAYLFSERYDEALKTFEDLRRVTLTKAQESGKMGNVALVP